MGTIDPVLDTMHQVDAYNLIETIADGELESAAEFMKRYAAIELDEPGATNHLARHLAIAAASLLEHADHGRVWLEVARHVALHGLDEPERSQ